MNKLTILVVEDDMSVKNLITTTLKAHDYRFLTAKNGETAIMEASSHNPDVVLLDLGLPDMDGIEVIKKIRTWSNIPIIVISARSEDTDKIDALDAGADDYLTKPFSVEELLARLRVTQRRIFMMQSETMSQSSVFKNGDLTIDYAAGCVYVKEKELHLTPIEYKLLCLLSHNVGKVLTILLSCKISGGPAGKMILRHCVCLWLHCVKKLRKNQILLSIFRHILVWDIECSRWKNNYFRIQVKV